MLPIVEARKLLDDATDETQLRTAASRAYYAAFRWLIEYAKSHGFKPQSTGEDHRLLIEFFKVSGHALLTRIGNHRLPRLRKLRNHADYVYDVPFTRGLATEAVEGAEEILRWLGAPQK